MTGTNAHRLQKTTFTRFFFEFTKETSMPRTFLLPTVYSFFSSSWEVGTIAAFFASTYD